VTRIYANLPEILDGLRAYAGSGAVTSRSAERAGEGTTFEASCYTDPLALEHLSGGLAETIRFFGAWDAHVQLRWTTKFDDVGGLLDLAHNGRTRIRFSVNAQPITKRFEGGTASLADRLNALHRVAHAGYPVGLTIAPIMPLDGWREHYAALLRDAAAAVAGAPGLDLTVECITHRFTSGSRDVLSAWYPRSLLEMDDAARSAKRTKFGSVKYVYPRAVMRELRTFFETELAALLPSARLLYWT
jgi:spore photoproduct lyase